jgi:hypothetical protein
MTISRAVLERTARPLETREFLDQSRARPALGFAQVLTTQTVDKVTGSSAFATGPPQAQASARQAQASARPREVGCSPQARAAAPAHGRAFAAESSAFSMRESTALTVTGPAGRTLTIEPRTNRPTPLENLAIKALGADDRMSELIDAAARGQAFTPAQLLSMQAEVFRHAQVIEVVTRSIDKTVAGLKQLLATQV